MKKNKILLLCLKEKQIFFIGSLAGIALFFIYLIFLYVPLYKTESTVFIKNIPKQDIITDLGGGSTIYSESGFSNPLFNLTQILESDLVAEKSYKKLSKKYPDDFNKLGINSEQEWFKEYKQLIKSKIKPSTDIITISFKWPNKLTAKQMLDEITREFKNVNLGIKQTVETKQRKFLDTQLTDIGLQLDEVRMLIKNYKVDNKAIDISNETYELTKARVELQKKAEILKSKVRYYDKKLSDLSEQLNFPNVKTALRATSIGEDSYLVELNKKLAVAKQNLAELEATFTEHYPEVIAAKNEIKSLEKSIAERRKESTGDINVERGVYDKPSQDLVAEMAKVQAERVSVRSELDSILKGVQNFDEHQTSLPSKVLGLEELQKQEKALATAYENIKQKQLEATIQENEVVDNIVILDQPSPPKFILSFIVIRFLGIISVALLFSFAIAVIKEDMENKWTNSEEIEEVTGLKVLGILPWLKNPEIIAKDAKQFIQKSDSIMGISYGEIATNLIRRSYLKDAQAISFVSTVVFRGKSSMLPNITATLTRLNKSVILIVTDYEESQKLLHNFNIKPSSKKKDMIDIIERINLHLRIYKDSDPKVITELLEEAFIPIMVEGSDVFQLLCVNKDVNMYDYVGTRGFKTIVNFLKQYYEFILIDTPAKPLIFPEFNAISTVSDGVIIAAAMETNRDGLIQIIEKFEKTHAKILGIIAREENVELEEIFANQIN